MIERYTRPGMKAIWDLKHKYEIWLEVELQDVVDAACGGVPEWLKGTDCKSVGLAYAGSNPALPTTPKPHQVSVAPQGVWSEVGCYPDAVRE